MLDPSMPWLAPGYRKFISREPCSNHSTSFQFTSTDDFHLTHSTPVTQQRRRVRIAVVSGRSQSTPPSSPRGTPRQVWRGPQSALPTTKDHRGCYGLEQPVLQRPKSAFGRAQCRETSETELASSVTQHRLPRTVKSARQIRHRPSTAQNKSITQVERLHHARLLMVSSVPVGQTTDHKLCAYCPAECRPKSSSSHFPTPSTGLSAADLPSHFDRTRFGAKGTTRPRTAPTYGREFLHPPRHNYIQRGTVPHYTHFIRSLSLYPRDGSPLPLAPTIVVQEEDADRRSLPSQSGDTDTVRFSASVMDDSDWEDNLADGAFDATNNGEDYQLKQNEDVPSVNQEATEKDEPPMLRDILGDDTNDELPTNPYAPPVTKQDDTTTPTADVDRNEDDACGLKEITEGEHKTDDLPQGSQFEGAISLDGNQEPESIDEDVQNRGADEDVSKVEVETDAEVLQNKVKETLVIEKIKEDEMDLGKEATELKLVITKIPTKPPSAMKKESMQRDKKAGSRKKSRAKKAVRIQKPDGSKPVKPGERYGSTMGEVGDSGDPERTTSGAVLDSGVVPEKAYGTENSPEGEKAIIPVIVLPADEIASNQETRISETKPVGVELGPRPAKNSPEGEKALIPDTVLSADEITPNQETQISEAKPVGVKLGPRPAKVKVDFMAMDSDAMTDILNMEMKLRRRKAADNLANSENLVEVSNHQNKKKASVPASWNSSRVALSRRAGRFEVPMDIRDMIGLTPIEYLLKYCKVSSQRRSLYKRTFSRVDWDKDGKLTRKELDRAVTEALVDTVNGEQVAEVLGSIGADNNNLMMTFDLFAPFCALLERLHYSQYLTEYSDRDARLKDRIEDADFGALEWKLDGYDINDDLRRLLHSL